MKSKKLIIILIISVLSILAAAGIVFAVLWFNNPGRIITKALEDNDTETILENYGKLKNEEDIELVQKEMLKIALEAYDDYQSEKITYEEAMEILEPLGEEILADNDEYHEILDNIEIVEKSRKNFDKAEEFFEAEEYEKALDLYLLVDSKDKKNYKKAKDRIEECKALLIYPIEGKYSLTYDFGDYFASGAGITYDITFPLDVVLTFNEDGTGSIAIDEDSIEEAIKGVIPQMTDYMYGVLAAKTGFSRKQIDLYLKVLGFNSMESYLNDIAYGYMDDIMDKITESTQGKTSMDFEYTWDGKTIDFIDQKFSMKAEVNDDALIIHSVNGDIAVSAMFLTIGYPITLERIE